MKTKKLKDYILKNNNKIKINSKDVINGDIFVALQGKKNHGSCYIEEAMNKGARFILTNKILKKNGIDSNIFIVDDVLVFLDLLANEKRRVFKGKVIGITGSIGKTSVKENLKFFLQNKFNVSASVKSYNNYLGIIISLLNMDLNSVFSIFEIGTSDFNEIKKLTSIVKPTQVIVTNIYPTHLEKLINVKNIAKEKSDIFNPKYNENIELAILSDTNPEEKIVLNKAQKIGSFKIITIGNDQHSYFQKIKLESFDDDFSKISLKYFDNDFFFLINNNQIPRLNNFLFCLAIFIFI